MKNAESALPVIIKLPEKQILTDRLVYSLDFAKRSVQHLIIDGHVAPEDAPWYVRPEKIVAETAFLIVFAQAGKANKKIAKALASLAEVLIPLARSKVMLLNICLKPALALDYAHAHICMKYAGYPDKKFDSALTDALKSQAAQGIERLPYRMLEREWLRGIWDSRRKRDNLDFWVSLSCLNHPLDIFNESSDGVYALTHAIMYAAFRNNQILGVNTEKLLEMLEALLVRYMDEQDYDIAGELLVAWSMLKKPLSPSAQFALNCLFRIEKRVGFLPAPHLDLSMIEGKELIARRTYIYSLNYHTALVMGLLCSSLLENFDNLDVVANETEYSAELMTWLEKKITISKQVHWKEYFVKLNKVQKRELIPWIYQAFLARSLKKKDYNQVNKMLKLSKGSKLEALAMSLQAKELLQRLKRHAT